MFTRSVSRNPFSRAVAQRFCSSYKVNTTISDIGVHTAELENGVKIIVAPKGFPDPCTAIGLHVNVGSALETHETHGSAHYLRRFLYKSTNRVSGLRLTRTIENRTASFDAVNERDGLLYKATCHPDNTIEVADVMADILRPRLSEWEHRQVREIVRDDVQQRAKDTIATLGDQIRHTAFRGAGIGRSPLCPEHNINKIYPDHLADYVLSNVYGKNITLVVLGDNDFPTEELIKDLAKTFALFPAQPSGTSAPAPVSSTYYGGEFLQAGGANVYVEAYKGVERSSPEIVTQYVLASILGDASSSFTLPGELVNGRLTNDFAGCNAASFTCSDSQTLFGVRAMGNSSVKELGEKVHKQLANLGTSKVTAAELANAQAALKQKLRTFADSRLGHLGLFLKGVDVEAVIKGVDHVTANDLQTLAQKILSSPRTTVMRGDLSQTPSFSQN